MIPEELVDLIKAGESDTVEFKECFGDAVIDAIGTFANTHGGVVIVGVSNSGEIRGVTIGKETLTQWSNDIAQSTDPRVVTDIGEYEVEGQTVVMIEVQESPLKPVATKGKYFKRVAKGKQRMSQHEIAQMHLRSVGQSWENCRRQRRRLMISTSTSSDITHSGQVRCAERRWASASHRSRCLRNWNS